MDRSRRLVPEDKGSALPSIFVNSLPKSGTHLLASILSRVPGFQLQDPVLNRKLRWHPMNYLGLWDQRTCLVGIGQPNRIRLATLSFLLRRLRQGHYALGHIPYQECVAELLDRLAIRCFLVLRDPRDVVVSQVHYVLGRSSHYLHRDYARMGGARERLLASIRGVTKRNGKLKSVGIAEKLDAVLGWLQVESVLVLRFEELIGERGGGSAEAQKRAIMGIGDHIGLDIGEEQALSIGSRSFGRGGTYRQGRVGSWRSAFDGEITDVFKGQAGEYVIKLGYETDDGW